MLALWQSQNVLGMKLLFVGVLYCHTALVKLRRPFCAKSVLYSHGMQIFNLKFAVLWETAIQIFFRGWAMAEANAH